MSNQLIIGRRGGWVTFEESAKDERGQSEIIVTVKTWDSPVRYAQVFSIPTSKIKQLKKWLDELEPQ